MPLFFGGIIGKKFNIKFVVIVILLRDNILHTHLFGREFERMVNELYWEVRRRLTFLVMNVTKFRVRFDCILSISSKLPIISNWLQFQEGILEKSKYLSGSFDFDIRDIFAGICWNTHTKKLILNKIFFTTFSFSYITVWFRCN